MPINFVKVNLTPLTTSGILIVLASALVLSVLIALVYKFTHSKSVYDQSFLTTLIVLPVIVSVIIVFISDNLARAFSLAGIFALVRFRMAINDSRDIVYILSGVAIGLAVSLGFIGFAVIITIVFALILLVIHFLNLEKSKTPIYKLKVYISEDLDYYNLFDDVFNNHLKHYKLTKVKTREAGSIFELTYHITFKTDDVQKVFIDEIKALNNNLTVTLYNDFKAINIEDYI